MEQERLSIKEAIRYGVAIADALCVAHKEGVLHRDLKPDNVILARDGRLRILDFGLSHFTQSKGAPDDASPDERIIKDLTLKRSNHSKSKKIQGTPAYMAPEQWRAEEVGPDRATDDT